MLCWFLDTGFCTPQRSTDLKNKIKGNYVLHLSGENFYAVAL